MVRWPSLSENLRLGRGTVLPEASQMVTLMSSPEKRKSNNNKPEKYTFGIIVNLMVHIRVM